MKACFQELKAFHSFERDGCVLTLELSLLFQFLISCLFLSFSVEVSLSSVCDMTKDDLQWAFELMKTSVKEL